MELILFPYKKFRFMILHSHFLCLWINSNFIPISLVCFGFDVLLPSVLAAGWEITARWMVLWTVEEEEAEDDGSEGQEYVLL